jgi:transcriptional regulator with XRE-family HTH domain
MESALNVARAVMFERVAQGMTQAELGTAAGTKQSRISQVEAMKGNPRFDTLDRIAQALGLAVALVPKRPIITSETEFTTLASTREPVAGSPTLDSIRSVKWSEQPTVFQVAGS